MKTTINLDHLLGLAQLSLAFGRINRATFHEDGKRPEGDAEHSIMLALLVAEVASKYDSVFSVDAAVRFAIVHDLVEAYTPGGDTNSFGITAEALEGKKAREAVGWRLLLERHVDCPWLLRQVVVYEQQKSLEARLVRYLDKVTPKLTHALNGCAALKVMGVTKEDVERIQREEGVALRRQYPELQGIVGPIFDEACRRAEAAW